MFIFYCHRVNFLTVDTALYTHGPYIAILLRLIMRNNINFHSHYKKNNSTQSCTRRNNIDYDALVGKKNDTPWSPVPALSLALDCDNAPNSVDIVFRSTSLVFT